MHACMYVCMGYLIMFYSVNTALGKILYYCYNFENLNLRTGLFITACVIKMMHVLAYMGVGKVNSKFFFTISIVDTIYAHARYQQFWPHGKVTEEFYGV